MITIQAIEENGIMIPETPQTLNFGSYFDGTNFNYFESQQEANEYAASIVVPLDDPRKQPDYYLVRESVGKALVNEVSNELLVKYKTGELTLVQVMGIEESLKEVISALGRGQFYTASYKLAISQGAPTDMKATLTTTIQGLIQSHYA